MNPRRTGTALAVLALAVALPAGAQARTYRIVSATHSSSAAKTDEHYTGTSSATWRLPHPVKLRVSRLAGRPVAQAYLHVRGSFAARATTDWPGSCSLTAPTGSKAYPAVAPGLVTLTIGPDPNGSGRTFAAFIGQQATLGNPYFGTECSTDLTGEPTPDDTELLPISPKAFTHRKVQLRFAGSSSASGIDYRWSTVFRLVRVK